MQVFILVTVAWIFSVCLHEFGHAAVAYQGGDTTVKDKGYLTLNPIHYTHPVYSLLMPLVFLFLGGIGLPGGAVYINDSLLRSRGWRTATSLAGPFMNLVLILLLCLPFWAGVIDDRFGPALAFLIQLQICAVIFNLLPIPPLDGFHALAPWLPAELRVRLFAQANTFLLVLILLLWYVPPANNAFWGLVYGLSDRLGIDSSMAAQGWNEFRFWRH
ncbi:MAG: site-2 protease family protein [Limisphaerales bacterium]